MPTARRPAAARGPTAVLKEAPPLLAKPRDQVRKAELLLLRPPPPFVQVLPQVRQVLVASLSKVRKAPLRPPLKQLV